jgi:hypothetical protein
MGILGIGARAAGAAATGAAAGGKAAAKDVPLFVRAWRAIPQQHRPYVVYATGAGLASTAVFASESGDPKARAARMFGGMAPIAAAGMGVLLLGASTGSLAARLRPATKMLKWTAPIAVPAYAFRGGQADPPQAPAKPGGSKHEAGSK